MSAPLPPLRLSDIRWHTWKMYSLLVGLIRCLITLSPTGKSSTTGILFKADTHIENKTARQGGWWVTGGKDRLFLSTCSFQDPAGKTGQRTNEQTTSANVWKWLQDSRLVIHGQTPQRSPKKLFFNLAMLVQSDKWIKGKRWGKDWGRVMNDTKTASTPGQAHFCVAVKP